MVNWAGLFGVETMVSDKARSWPISRWAHAFLNWRVSPNDFPVLSSLRVGGAEIQFRSIS